MDREPGKKIAVVGGGVAGIVASYLLSKKHTVEIFEKNTYLGGHTSTVVLTDGPDAGTPVDTGFIVFNDYTYPNFIKFLGRLGVEARESNMSFSYYNEDNGFQYAGTGLNGLFAQRSNLLSPSFYQMLMDIQRFAVQGREDLEKGILETISLGEYVKEKGFSSFFVENYLAPMGAAIWSTPAGKILEFPARNFILFFKNHGLLQIKDRPKWRTVKGGSHSYVKAFLQVFPGKVHLDCPIKTIRRDGEKVELELTDGACRQFDYVVVATHGDQALALLESPTEEEVRWLGTWKYSQNRTLLHTDSRVLPPLKNAWASWNYCKEKEAGDNEPVSLTYHMNRLQGFTDARKEYCVTLNRIKEIPQGEVIREFLYEHPIYNRESVESQKHLPSLNGECRTFYCGSYFRFGFHEDAVSSAVAVGELFGIQL